MSMMDSALGMMNPMRQSLIPPQLLARLSNNLAGQVPMAAGQNPAMQLQNAHHYARNRGRTGMRPVQDGGPSSPTTKAVLGAKMMQDQQDAQQQDQPQDQPGPGAGTMSIQQGSGRDGRPVMNAQRILEAGDRFNRENQIMGKSGEQANAFWTPLDHNFHLQPGTAQQVQNQVQNAQHIGYNVTGAGPQQQQPQMHPALQMLSAFQGHVPDEYLNAAHNALLSGVPIQQVYSHLQSAAQQQATHADQAQRQQQLARQQQLKQVQSQRQRFEKAHPDVQFDQPPTQFEITNKAGGTDLDQTGFNLYRQDAVMRAKEQQLEDGSNSSGNQSQSPTRPLDHGTAAQFLQQAGGDKDKARELARQAGWSF